MSKVDELLELESAGVKLPPELQRDLDDMRAAGLVSGPKAGTDQSESAPMVKKAVREPVLREQPGMIERAISPGGIISPENLGTIIGGLYGAAAGAPFGPPGVFLGGVLSAGGGAMVGRGAEMIKEAVSGPYRTPGSFPLEQPNRSLAEIVGELGGASQRGMMGQAVGETIGGAIKMALAPFARKMTGASQAALDRAKNFDIDITPAQVFESAGGARLEGIAGRSILGSTTAELQRSTQAKQAAEAVNALADNLAPGLSKDYQSVGTAIRATAEGRIEGLRNAVKTMVRQVAGGTPLNRADAGELVKESKDTLLESLKVHASRLYDAVKVSAGDTANAVVAPNFKAAAQEILQRESALTGVQVRSAAVARGAASQFPKPAMTTAQKIEAAQLAGDPVDASSLPAQLAAKFGLDQDKVWTLDALREWQSRLGALVSSTENRVARRDFTKAFAAVSKDIDEWGKNLAPEAAALLRRANEFYKTQIADVYYNRLISGIDKAEPDLVANLFFGPDKSAIAMDRVHKAIGEKAWRAAAGSYLDNVLTGATRPNGTFSPDQALKILNNHNADVLERLFGKNFTAEKAVVKMLQRHPTKTIEGVIGTESDQVVDMLVPKQGGTEAIRQMRQLLPAETYDRTAGALLKKIVERSQDNNGAFSFDRFLTQVNSRTGYTQDQLRGLLGPHYGEFREATDLMARINRTLKMSGNPSGTGQSLLSQFQLGGAILLGTDIAAKTWQGHEDVPQMLQHVGTGLVILSPAAIGKLIYSKGGLKWLTEGIHASPGSEAAIRAASTLKGILDNEIVGIAPERDSVKRVRDKTVADEIRAALQSPDVPIDQKIKAALSAARVGSAGTLQLEQLSR